MPRSLTDLSEVRVHPGVQINNYTGSVSPWDQKIALISTPKETNDASISEWYLFGDN